MNKVMNAILEGLAPVIKLVLNEVIKIMFREFYAKDPMNAKLVAVELYPILDVKLENIVGDTETILDDAAVAGVMEGIEVFAREANFDLPDLDATEQDAE